MLAALWSQGKCNQTWHNGTGEDDARAWGAAMLLCGDWPTLRDTVDYARRAAGARVADDLASYGAAARGDKGAFARARTRAADASLWSAEGTDRARRYGPLLAAARAEGKS